MESWKISPAHLPSVAWLEDLVPLPAFRHRVAVAVTGVVVMAVGAEGMVDGVAAVQCHLPQHARRTAEESAAHMRAKVAEGRK
ncbi:hypothetical protein D3C72_1212270 [compost metagenome]